MNRQTVAPLVGAWIEISCVNPGEAANFVAPLVGAWIEMSENSPLSELDESLLSWERGLKSRKWVNLYMQR